MRLFECININGAVKIQLRFLPDNFNILYPHLVAGDKICIVTAAVRTFFAYSVVLYVFTVATVGETFKDYHFKLGVFHIIRFFFAHSKQSENMTEQSMKPRLFQESAW